MRFLYVGADAASENICAEWHLMGHRYGQRGLQLRSQGITAICSSGNAQQPTQRAREEHSCWTSSCWPLPGFFWRLWLHIRLRTALDSAAFFTPTVPHPDQVGAGLVRKRSGGSTTMISIITRRSRLRGLLFYLTYALLRPERFCREDRTGIRDRH